MFTAPFSFLLLLHDTEREKERKTPFYRHSRRFPGFLSDATRFGFFCLLPSKISLAFNLFLHIYVTSLYLSIYFSTILWIYMHIQIHTYTHTNDMVGTWTWEKISLTNATIFIVFKHTYLRQILNRMRTWFSPCAVYLSLVTW